MSYLTQFATYLITPGKQQRELGWSGHQSHLAMGSAGPELTLGLVAKLLDPAVIMVCILQYGNSPHRAFTVYLRILS
jgi:hypothetical protein